MYAFVKYAFCMMYSSTLFLKDTQKYELSYLLRTLRIHICMYIIQHIDTYEYIILNRSFRSYHYCCRCCCCRVPSFLTNALIKLSNGNVSVRFNKSCDNAKNTKRLNIEFKCASASNARIS